MDTKKTRGNAQHPRKDGMAGGEGPWHRDDARTEGGSRGRKPQAGKPGSGQPRGGRRQDEGKPRASEPRRGGALRHGGARARQRPIKPVPARCPKPGDGPCPLMRVCGSCELLGLPYRKQLARKQAAMEELFGPVLAEHGWNGLAIDPIVGMGGTAGDEAKLASPRGFRHKAATPFAPGPRGQVRCGLFARGTHDIIAVPDCIVEAPGARRILNEVARAAQACGIPAYDEDARRGWLRYAVLRLGWKTDEGLLTIVTAKRDLPRGREFLERLRVIDPRITTIAQNVNGRVTNAILGSETHVLAGPPRMRDRLLSCEFEISPTAFYQTNPEQTEVLYQLAIDGMALEMGDVLMDAYCGSGTIGLAAAREAADAGRPIRLLGVERNPAGIEDANRNAQVNGLAGTCTFKTMDATEYMQRAAARGERVDVLAMDPPRAGSTPEFIAAAASMGPRRIVYISCNPVTQARDLADLARHGYRLERLTPVDMFPHTTHVETVAVLTR